MELLKFNKKFIKTSIADKKAFYNTKHTLDISFSFFKQLLQSLIQVLGLNSRLQG